MPTEVEISSIDSQKRGYVFLFTENVVVSPYIGLTKRFDASPRFYTVFSFMMDFYAYYFPQSRYFDVHYSNPHSFQTHSLTGIASASYSLNLTGEHYQIEMGISLDLSWSLLSYENSVLRSDMITGDLNGNQVVFNSGERVDLYFSRDDIFWGYYIKASAFF